MEISPLYSAKTIANLFNMTPRRIQQLVSEGVIVKKARGKYDLVACVRGYIKYLQERAFGKDVGATDLQDHKARLTKENADRAAMENALMRDELGRLDDMSRVIDKIIRDSRQRLLTIPTKVAPIVRQCKTIPAVRAVLQDAIHEALNDLTKIHPRDLIVGKRKTGVVGTAARSKRKRVG